MADTVPKLLNLAAVAEALAVSPHTVRMWVRKGRLTPVRLCRRLLFNPTDIEQLVAGASGPCGAAKR
ncbi:MAG: helix-turn-helix domain-containing protein [Terracidiphilus sp.]|jgi:excisionase family DNA binding protein